MKEYTKHIVIIGSGVAGINAATELVDNGYPGKLITIIDKGQDPYKRTRSEVMEGYNGAGAWSDSKLTRSIHVGGHLAKYCGEEKAYELMDQALFNFKRFHPNPEAIRFDEPLEEPEFIRPYFNLRLFPVWHFGTDFLAKIGQNWYDYLASKGIKFLFRHEVDDIDFDNKKIKISSINYIDGEKVNNMVNILPLSFDKLIYATGKSGMKFTQHLLDKYNLPIINKPIQLGVRLETEHKFLEKLIKIAYDYKLYQKPDENVSLRSFCSNSYAAFVALEDYSDVVMSNGHAKSQEQYYNWKTNFGIIMEIKGEKDPYSFCMDIVKKCQGINSKGEKTCLYFSPDPNRIPPIDSEGNVLDVEKINNLERFKNAFGKYAKYITNFISDLKKIFPEMGDNWGMFIPEAKFLTDEVLVNHNDLSLLGYKDIHFAGDALSARGIIISASHGVMIAQSILND